MPTNNKFNLQEIVDDKNRLIRNLKLKDFFYGRDNPTWDPKVKCFREPSTWTPTDRDISPSTIELIDKINKDFKTKFGTINNKIIFTKHKHNISKAERKALNDLINNPDIIIKRADKGGCLVIMDMGRYIAECETQLSNTNYYKCINTPLRHDNLNLINGILNRMRDNFILTEKEYNYFYKTDRDIKQRVFYTLPKIHKDKTKWLDEFTPPGRPIVSGIDSEFHRISEYLDYYIQPLSKQSTYILKDSFDLVNLIQNKSIPINSILFTADVSALYTNMNLDYTMNLIANKFNEFKILSRPDSYLLELLEITLFRNDFRFLDQTYLQTTGIPMGIKYAPSIANLYMGAYDELFVREGGSDVVFYKRFLDDIFGVWVGQEAKLVQLFKDLNFRIPGIEVTPCIHHHFVNFLDIYIYIFNYEGQSKLNTGIYFKETNTHQLLHSKSFHPGHTIRGIIKGQLTRFARLTEYKLEYLLAAELMFSYLIVRGYNRKTFNRIKYEVWVNKINKINNNRNSNQNHELTGRGDKLKSKINIILPYASFTGHLCRTWRNWIRESPRFSDMDIGIAYKRNKNLLQLLCRSDVMKLNPNLETEPLYNLVLALE